MKRRKPLTEKRIREIIQEELAKIPITRVLEVPVVRENVREKPCPTRSKTRTT